MKVLLVLLLTAAAYGQTFHTGWCPQPPVQKDFNITKVEETKLQVLFSFSCLPAASCHIGLFTSSTRAPGMKSRSSQLRLKGGNVSRLHTLPSLMGRSTFAMQSCCKIITKYIYSHGTLYNFKISSLSICFCFFNLPLHKVNVLLLQ